MVMNYFQPLVEKYFYINIIPETKIFGLPDYFYFYAVIILFVVAFLVLAVFAKVRPSWLFLKGVGPSWFLIILLFFWVLTSLPWFITQLTWLKSDFAVFFRQNLVQKQGLMVKKIIQSHFLPSNWFDFYDFLKFGENNVPNDSKVYLLPASPLFINWAKYWLYPNLRLVDSSKNADYIFSFNVDLPSTIFGFESFVQFAPNKVVLKRVNSR